MYLKSALLITALAATARAEITLLGTANIPADAKDKSGLTGDVLTNDGNTSTTVAQDTFGSCGSAIAYTGHDNLYIQVDDRGPNDGNARFLCRAQIVKLTLAPDTATPVAVSLEKTIMLKTETGDSFVGSSRAIATNTRLDPEGVRVAPNGKDFFISDEYGPFIFKFSPEGKRIAKVDVPEKFLITSRSESAEQEIKNNDSGRITNRGMEGLAITPDGKKLVGIMQSPLIQDGALDSKYKRIGVNCRILEVDLATGKTREFLYPMESEKHGNNEILAINDHEFLVLERDNKEGEKAAFKKLFHIDLSAATDISAVEKLPTTGIPAGVKPVTKSVFLDLLDPKFKLAGPAFPEKIEGIAWGPDIAGKHTLVVTNDNDLLPTVPNFYWVFTVDPADVPGYVLQEFK